MTAELQEKLALFKGKRVLITGHTGFKGGWLCLLLRELGAEIAGYSLPPPTKPSLYELADVSDVMSREKFGDVRDFPALAAFFSDFHPEIVIHLAAQPLVREGYRCPQNTYAVNVMGTVNILECIRQSAGIISALNVTTDKVYRNREWYWGYRENDPLDGFDPYSNSKSCSELVTAAYRRSFFSPQTMPLSTARAGNVIGGGDFSTDRIIPDCVRALQCGQTVKVRNPASVRPYQHVLEPLTAYLLIAAGQILNPEKAGNYNVGPDDACCLTTGELVSLFCRTWGEGALWESLPEVTAPHEAGLLRLDCSKIKTDLHWQPHWGIAAAVEKTCVWHKAHFARGNMSAVCREQIREYLHDA